MLLKLGTFFTLRTNNIIRTTVILYLFQCDPGAFGIIFIYQRNNCFHLYRLRITVSTLYFIRFTHTTLTMICLYIYILKKIPSIGIYNTSA